MKRYYRRFNLFEMVVLGLLAVGIIASFINRPFSLLIPLIIFGLIYYFYKHPEKLYGLNRPKNHHSTKNKSYKKNRNVHFKIINGKRDDNDDKPRYH